MGKEQVGIYYQKHEDTQPITTICAIQLHKDAIAQRPEAIYIIWTDTGHMGECQMGEFFSESYGRIIFRPYD